MRMTAMDILDNLDILDNIQIIQNLQNFQNPYLYLAEYLPLSRLAVGWVVEEVYELIVIGIDDCNEPSF